MPSLSHKRLHGRAVILRALTRAGQFAHVPVDAFAPHLDDLYNINLRLEWGRNHNGRGTTVAERAVPLALVKANETRLFSDRWYDAEVVNYISLREGVTCCLCAGPERRFNATYAVPKGFVLHVCPTFLRAEGLRDDRQPPLCHPCQSAVNGRIWREHGIYEPENRPEFWAAILAWLAANRTFRERVRDNAHYVSGLRFDPRRVLISQRLAA